MSRMSNALNVVLAAVVIAQGLMLLERDRTPGNIAAMPPDAADIPAQDKTGMIDGTVAISAQLARIDARLASLERSLPDTGATQTQPQPQSPAQPVVDAETASAADRRIAAMFPGRDISHEDMMHFQASLAQLSPVERLAMSTALSRAVNQDRIKLRF